MDPALWSAKSGMEAQHKNIPTISNNLANASTVGFKKDRLEFADLPYQLIREPGAFTTDETRSSTGIMIGTGVRVAASRKIFSPGSAIPTNNKLDLAIEGRGFFRVELPQTGEFIYTRTGTLHLDEQGQLVLHNGYVIQPAMTIPEGAQDISISENGIVSVTTHDGAVEEVGRFELVDFINPSGLQPMGNNLYQETLSSGQPIEGNPMLDGFGKIQQGELEASNVNIVEEMVNLIEAQRGFEMTSKVISAVDNMYQKLDRET